MAAYKSRNKDTKASKSFGEESNIRIQANSKESRSTSFLFDKPIVEKNDDIEKGIKGCSRIRDSEVKL